MAEKTQQSILKITLDNDAAIKAMGDYQEEIGKATKAINSLKETQKLLDAQYEQGAISKQEYNEQTRKVTDAVNAEKQTQKALQTQLSQVQYQMQKNIQQNIENEGSLKSMRGQLSQLNAEFDSLSKEERENADVGGKLMTKIQLLTKDITAAEEATGRFQRNVGHYENAMKGIAQNTDVLDKSLKFATGGLGGLKGGFEALSASPAIAIFGIVVGALSKMWQSLKENENAMASIKKAIASLQPVFDFFSGVLEKVVGWIGEIILRVSDFLGNSGIFQKIISGVVGIGNSILQFVIAPFKGVIEAIKVFKEQGIKGFRDAAKAFGNEMKSGVSFKSNFEAGQSVGDALVKGISSKKKPANDAGMELAKEVEEGFKALDIEKIMEERMNEMLRKQKELQDLALDGIADFQKDMEADIEAGMEEIGTPIADAAKADYEKQKEIDDERKQHEAEMANARKEALFSYADATASVLDSLADMYESDAEASKESQEKVKALRIAGATIDMLSGVVAAVSQAMKLGFPIGPIVGAAQSAAVIAAGSSNIAKMKSQKLAKGGYVSGPGTGTSDSVPAQLSNGESVMNARATSMFAPLLSSLNQIGGGNAIVPPAGADTEVLEQAIARGMRGANLSVSVTEIDTVRQRMDNIEGNANV